MQSEHDGDWGEWMDWAACPNGMAVNGMNVQIEPPQNGDDGTDDTAMNGLKLSCSMLPGMIQT